MSLRKAWFILPLAAALIALAAYFASRGKDGGESVVSEETTMEEHYAELDKMRTEGRLPIVKERAKAVKAMEAIIAEARNALAAGGVENPSDAQLKAEIEGHPEKYPEWKDLHAKVTRLNEEYVAKQREMQAAVREHMKRTGVVLPGTPREKKGK